MSYIVNLLISLDQFGNVIAGGNPDNTVSARVGKYNEDRRSGKETAWFWKVFEGFINTAFYPIDGPDHCHEAYFSDAGETFDTGTIPLLFIVIQFIFIIPVTMVIAVLTYTAWLFGIVSPKTIDRNKNISDRLYLVHAKLQGIEHELVDHDPKLEEALLSLSESMATQAHCVDELIKEYFRNQGGING